MNARTLVRLPIRTLSVVLLLASIAAPALAEKSDHFGVRAGVNLSAFAGEFGDLVKPDQRVAPNVALVYEHAFAPELAFHGEVGYSGKGGTLKSEGADPFGNPSTIRVDWKFEYLEVPLLLRCRWPGKVTPFFEIGPSVGVALAGKITSDPALFGDLDVQPDMKPIDLGWAAGAGVAFAAGPGRIGLEARYTRGFSDLYDISDNFASINQAWTFALSYSR
jgi:hypothetical protein